MVSNYNWLVVILFIIITFQELRGQGSNKESNTNNPQQLDFPPNKIVFFI